MGHGYVGDEPGAKKAFFAGESSVDELVNDDEHARPQIFTQGTDRADRNKVSHANTLHGIDIGAKVNLGGRYPMPTAMTRQKHHRLPIQLTQQKLIRRFSKWGVNALPALVA